MSTSDQDWIQWGERDPYFAVITDPSFHGTDLSPEARERFFHSGEADVAHLMSVCRRLAGPGFKPRRVLDFGCGVGRVLLPLARCFEEAVGLDISPGMLKEARRNADLQHVSNIRLGLSDADLSGAPGSFDLVHSCIVLQHVDIPQGRLLFDALVRRVSPGGVGAIQITYAKAVHADTFGQAPEVPAPDRRGGWWNRLVPRRPAPQPGPDATPGMAMNSYALSELAFMLQRAGIPGFEARFTDHGGEWGVFLYFARPAAA